MQVKCDAGMMQVLLIFGGGPLGNAQAECPNANLETQPALLHVIRKEAQCEI